MNQSTSQNQTVRNESPREEEPEAHVSANAQRELQGYTSGLTKIVAALGNDTHKAVTSIVLMMFMLTTTYGVYLLNHQELNDVHLFSVVILMIVIGNGGIRLCKKMVDNANMLPLDYYRHAHQMCVSIKIVLARVSAEQETEDPNQQTDQANGKTTKKRNNARSSHDKEFAIALIANLNEECLKSLRSAEEEIKKLGGRRSL